MYNPDTELLFPPRVLPALRDSRGIPWQELVATVIAAGPDSPEQIAIVLLMARLTSCATCNSDSYRAMKGCTVCAKQSLKRFRESDQILIEVFRSTREEVKVYMQKKTSHPQDDPSDHLQK
jgi:predicted peroxiredoxin